MSRVAQAIEQPRLPTRSEMKEAFDYDAVHSSISDICAWAGGGESFARVADAMEKLMAVPTSGIEAAVMARLAVWEFQNAWNELADEWVDNEMDMTNVRGEMRAD